MSSSCTETALVMELAPGGRAVVKVRRAEACQSCASKGACTALGGKTQDFTLLVDNSIHAEPGDEVQLTMSEVSVIKASAVLYLLPAMGLILGALLGQMLSPRLGIGEDPAAIGGALGGVGLGLLLSKIVGDVLSKKKEFVPRLTSVIGRGHSA